MSRKDTSGFYKQSGDRLICAPNAVYTQGRTPTLTKENRHTYTYPVEGWTWFDDEVTAYASFGLEQPKKLAVD